MMLTAPWLMGRRSRTQFQRTEFRTAGFKSTSCAVRIAIVASLSLASLSLGGIDALAQANVTTFQNDIGRTGQNLNETHLTPSNVNAASFGKLFSQTVDAQVYSQPLYLSGVTISGATHNVVYIATENDSVYAFDADSNGGANASPLWFASLLTTAHGAGSGATAVSSNLVSTDIQPLVGITGTPVIDPATGTLYVVSKTYESSNAVQRLHALDVTSGAEKFGGPVVLTASANGNGNGSVNGVLTFDPLWENQRPALLLLNGVVWIGFAAHGDNGPWHGWVLGYNAKTLQQTGSFCDSPNGTGSGIWMSGGGMAADQLDPVNLPYGRMFFPTGNGDYTATKPYNNTMDYGDSELRLDLTNGVPTISDEFTTYMQADLNSEDGDIASGGIMAIPTQTTGSYPHLAVQVGKQGWMYLLNRDNLGGYNATDQIVQEQEYAVGATGAWSSPAYWNGNVYWWGRDDYLKSFPLANGLLSTSPTKSAEFYGYPGATPAISANGATQGIVWSIDSEAYGSGPAVLQAHNASNVASLLYSSAASGNASRDQAGGAVKFAVPTIGNGKVFVGASGEVDVYGLLASTPTAATPVITPGSESFSGSVSVTITDATAGAQIYYTTDGTQPSTSSNLYSGAITVNKTETINAIASAANYLVSTQSSATYTNTAQAPPVTFSLPGASYGSPQTLTLSDTLSGTTIYYTTNGANPTTASAVYSSPLTISSSETVTAIATATGYNASTPVAQSYTIAVGSTGIQYSQGFATSTGQVILNGTSQLNDTRLQLTDGLANEAGSAFYYQPVSVQNFTTDFTFQLSNPNGEGIAFVIQNAAAGSAALGSNGAGLGYAGIANSVAIKFDLFSDAGEGADSTGLYTGGATPTTPSIDLSSTGINLHSDDNLEIHLTYNGSTLTMTITDMVTSATWTNSWTVNIPSIIGSNTAYVGFTGSTGTQTASQKILNWTYLTAAIASTPTFSPAPGSYSGAQTVTLSDTTSGATLYYTTNGSTPTTSSAVYSGPINVSASETLNAIAVASSYYNSSAGTAAYTITSTPAAPTFVPASGTYTTPQTVTISDPTLGVTFYLQFNNTGNSVIYTGPFTVSSSETVTAVAVGTNYAHSANTTVNYVINPTAATPTFSPSGGTYAGTQTVTISDGTSGAAIHYTTNGTTPSASSPVYSGPITVSSSETLNAIAIASGQANSAVATAAYTINTATGPVISFSPASLAFPATAAGVTSAAQSLTVTNTGSSAMTVSSYKISGTNASSFTLVGKTCGSSLAAGASCLISLSFTAPASGTASASLVATDNATGSPQSVALSGTTASSPAISFSPTSLTFPVTAAGATSAAQTLTVTNSGSGPMTVSSYKFSGTNASSFSLVGKSCGSSLAAGASCTLAITFTAPASGTATASLVATDNAAGSPQSVALSGTTASTPTLSFAPTSLTFTVSASGVTSAAQTLTVTNTGSSPMSVSSYKISGSNASAFTLASKTCVSSLAAGASCTLSITFTAPGSGTATASLVATDTAAGSPQSVPLSGTVAGADVSAATIGFSPASLTFPATKVGQTSAAQVLTVGNTSSKATLSVNSYTFAGAAASQFRLLSKTCGKTMAPQTTCTLSIVFEPTATGAVSASLVASDSAVGAPQSIGLHGSGN